MSEMQSVGERFVVEQVKIDTDAGPWPIDEWGVLDQVAGIMAVLRIDSPEKAQAICKCLNRAWLDEEMINSNWLLHVAKTLREHGEPAETSQ